MIGLIMATILQAGCTRRTSDKDLVFIDTPEAQETATQGRGLLGLGKPTTVAWVDTRSPEAFEAEHIPGAINVPFRDLNASLNDLRRYGILIVYGRDFGDIIPQAMAKTLNERGISDVRILRGGLRSWKRDGLETEGSDA
jgi:rhodanese-related sulfurtransferase